MRGRARHEVAWRRKFEWKVNFGSRNSSRSNGSWQMTPKTNSCKSVVRIFLWQLLWPVSITIQACRGYEIFHQYPYPYPQIFAWISIFHIHRCLSCVHVATRPKFPQSTVGAKGVHPPKTKTQTFPPKIVIIIWNCLRVNTYLHWNMCFVKYFQNFYENRCNSNVSVFSRMQVAFIYAWSGRLWCTFGFYFILALKMLENKKKTCASD